MTKSKLREFSLFKRMSPEEFAQLEALVEEVSYPDGEFIFKEGDRSSHLYLVGNGRVSLRVSLPNHKVFVIGTIEPGDVLGWSSVRRDRPYTAAAVAVGNVEALRIPGEKLARLFEVEPRIGYLTFAALLDVVAERLEEARIRIANMVHG